MNRCLLLSVIVCSLILGTITNLPAQNAGRGAWKERLQNRQQSGSGQAAWKEKLQERRQNQQTESAEGGT